MKKLIVVVCYLVFFFLLAFSTGCQPATPSALTTAEPTKAVNTTATASLIPPSPTNTALPSETPLPPEPTSTSSPLPPTATATIEIPALPDGLIPPPFLYITGTQLIQYQVDGITQVSGELGDDEIWDVLQIGEAVFILRPYGIQRVDLMTGQIEFVVSWDQRGDYGSLTETPNGNGFFYSLVGVTDCGQTTPINRIGFYQVETGTSRIVLENERNIGVIGLASDGQSFYGIPYGCDPVVGEFWEISITDGEVVNILTAWEETSQLDLGYGRPIMAPNAQYWAYLTDQPFALGLYFPEQEIYKRFELPNSPSYMTSMLWAEDSQQLYFMLNPDSSFGVYLANNSYGLWSFNVQNELFTQVIEYKNNDTYLHFVSDDNQWIFFTTDTEQGVVSYYLYLPTGQIYPLNLSPGGLGRIVR